MLYDSYSLLAFTFHIPLTRPASFDHHFLKTVHIMQFCPFSSLLLSPCRVIFSLHFAFKSNLFPRCVGLNLTNTFNSR